MESFGSLESKDGQKCAVCSIATTAKCSRCRKVSYCGRKHQKLHYKSHKEKCHPFMEAKSRELGRYLVATRDIAAGETICTEKPMLISPTGILEDLHPLCLGCCKILPGNFFKCPQVCPKCSWPLCQPDCADIAWHSNNECTIFQAKNVRPMGFLHSNSQVIYDFIKILRILLLKGRDPVTFKKIADLESHLEEVKNSDKGIDFASALHFIKAIEMDPTIYPEDLIAHICGVAIMNSDEVDNPKITPGQRYDSLIFEKGNRICHSCCGNTKTEMVNLENSSQGHRIIAVKDIKRGEKLTQFFGLQKKTYFQGSFERRRGLHYNFYFWCRCPRCSDKTEFGTYFSAIKCKSRKCPGYFLPLNSLDTATDPIWACNVCAKEKVYSSISRCLPQICNEISGAAGSDELLVILAKHENVTVHENHFLLMNLRHSLVIQLFMDRMAIQRGSEQFLDLCTKMEANAEKCLQVADKLVPGLTDLRGYLLFYLAQGKATSSQCFDQYVDHCEIREEWKRIYYINPEGSDGHKMYKYLMEEKEFGQLSDEMAQMADQLGIA